MIPAAGLMVALRKLEERTEPDRVKISGDGGKGGQVRVVEGCVTGVGTAREEQ